MFFDESKKSKHKKKTSGDHVEPSPLPIDVFVDIIIGHLEKSPAYMRSVGNHSFSLLCDNVKESTIDLILAVRVLVCCTCCLLITVTILATGTTCSCGTSRRR